MTAASHHHHGAFEGRHGRLYDVIARRLMRGFYRRVAADLVATTPPDARVLDLGTGPGVLLRELARQRPDLTLTGIDPAAAMVAAAERNVGATTTGRTCASVHKADVAELPFADDSFDVVTSSLSLHHWPDVPAAAAEIARVLRPTGRLCIYDVRSAPFSPLTEAATATSRFTGPARLDRFRTRLPLLPRCLRYELAAADATPPPQ